jgi:ATP-dependent DNA helicase RecQ
VQYLKHLEESCAAIVYCRSRKQCVEVAQMLIEEGLRAGVYHAGLQPQKRHSVQTDWQSGAAHRTLPFPA